MSDLIDAHVAFLRAQSASEKNTIRPRIWLLGVLHDWLPFGLLYASTDELEEFIGHNRAWGDWTRRTYAMHIRGFYRWAAGRFLDIDPTLGMAKPKTPEGVPRPVTEDELLHALDVAPEPWLTVIKLAAFQGLRISEAAGVWREDVTEDSTWIRMQKGGSPGSIDTHPYVWEHVRHRRAGPLTIRDGEWFTKYERGFFDAHGLPGVTMHRFRHRFATALREAGRDLFEIKDAMRHKSIQSTQGYTLVSGGQRRLAIRSLPSPARPPAGDQTN